MFPMLNAITTARSFEASLPMVTSHDSLRGVIRTALKAKLGVSAETPYDDWPWIVDVFPSNVVYTKGANTYRLKYKVAYGAEGTTPTVTFSGEPKQVHMAYTDTSAAAAAESLSVLVDNESVIITVSESAEFLGVVEDIQAAAREAAANGTATTIPVCIIKAGWGSSAYYSQEMLKQSGPRAFKKGTQMYWNHASEGQMLERPEGDLRDLAAVLTKDAYWDNNGSKGAGLYSEAKVFSDYSQHVKEKGPYIGCSINAFIKAHEGEAEGKQGRIADAFVPNRFNTVDFVTRAGAGGAPIVPAQESAREAPAMESNMTDQETKDLNALRDREAQAQKDLKDAQERLAAMESRQNRVLAIARVGSIIKESGAFVNPKLIARVCESFKMKDGKVDEDWAKETATDLLELVGESGAQVRDLGYGDEEETVDATTIEGGGRQVKVRKPQISDVTKGMESALSDLGMSEEAIKYALGVR